MLLRYQNSGLKYFDCVLEHTYKVKCTVIQKVPLLGIQRLQPRGSRVFGGRYSGGECVNLGPYIVSIRDWVPDNMSDELFFGLLAALILPGATICAS